MVKHLFFATNFIDPIEVISSKDDIAKDYGTSLYLFDNSKAAIEKSFFINDS